MSVLAPQDSEGVAKLATYPELVRHAFRIRPATSSGSPFGSPFLPSRLGTLFLLKEQRTLIENISSLGIIPCRISTDITNFAHSDLSPWSPLFIFFGVNHLGGATDRGNELLRVLEDSAPLKLPARYCFRTFLPCGLENIS